MYNLPSSPNPWVLCIRVHIRKINHGSGSTVLYTTEKHTQISGPLQFKSRLFRVSCSCVSLVKLLNLLPQASTF